ncbi:MAG: hypothetical protein Q8R79_02265 [Legionellaceae bacterium]|nr:hypothetical protein [Legionellaceae bacterium]
MPEASPKKPTEAENKQRRIGYVEALKNGTLVIPEDATGAENEFLANLYAIHRTAEAISKNLSLQDEGKAADINMQAWNKFVASSCDVYVELWDMKKGNGYDAKSPQSTLLKLSAISKEIADFLVKMSGISKKEQVEAEQTRMMQEYNQLMGRLQISIQNLRSSEYCSNNDTNDLINACGIIGLSSFMVAYVCLSVAFVATPVMAPLMLASFIPAITFAAICGASLLGMAILEIIQAHTLKSNVLEKDSQPLQAKQGFFSTPDKRPEHAKPAGHKKLHDEAENGHDMHKRPGSLGSIQGE